VALKAGVPPALFLVALLVAGLLLAAVGPLVERVLRLIYGRDESFQMLLTFALVLIFEDVIRFLWGTSPYQMEGSTPVRPGRRGRRHRAVYNLIVIAAALLIAVLMGWFLARTRFGRIVRATAENREMSEALGVNMTRVYARVFTLGTALGTVGGALVVPATAAMSEMGIDVIVEAFAVVVIGCIGSCEAQRSAP
jgi:branched-chain amino acid transport system permease protein